jgi:hypothetical protein
MTTRSSTHSQLHQRSSPRVGATASLALIATLTLSGQTPTSSQQSATAGAAPVLEAATVRSFTPTERLSATNMEGWKTTGGNWIGAAEGVMLPRQPGAGGWLLSSRAYQDVAITAMFQCIGDCKAGVVLRAETAGSQTKGILYSFGPGEILPFRVTLDADGKEVERVKLDPGPSPYPASLFTFRAEFPGLGNLMPTDLGASRPAGALRPSGEWNHIEIYLSGNTLRGVLNGRGIPEGGVLDATPRAYGRVGLYAAGGAGSEVRFRDVGIKTLDEKVGTQPVEVTAPRFRKQQLDSLFYSEAVTAADVNRDGNMDVIAGPFIYLGPDFLTRREIFIPRAYIATSYPDALLASAGDYTGDGYPDVLYTGEPGRPGFLYVNPGAEVRRWDKHMVIASVDNEVAFADDIDGDGKAEYIFGDGGLVGYAKAGADPTKPWPFHPVTEKGPWGAMYAHGLGTGDINGDGRKDIVQAYGWWEQPASPTKGPWTYHPQAFGRWGPQQGGGGGARAYVYDVNGDGRNDVVTSLEAHGWGLAWFEQKRDAAGVISFVRHMIMDDLPNANSGVAVAALHALALADIDGDGLDDIVTGKRWWGHFGENPSDPDAWGAPVVYWFRLVRSGQTARYEPELVNNNSGVGTDMIAVDLNKDGLADIMTSTRRGTIIFLTQRSDRR